MKSVVFVLTVLLTFAVVQAEDQAKNEPRKEVPIYELNEETFNTTMKNADFLVVCFYTKKSRESAKFEPIYKQTAEAMWKENRHIVFARVDTMKYPGVEKHHFILALPTVKFYKKGRHYDFRGQMTPEHLKTWIHLAMNVPQIMSSQQELEDLKKRGTVILGCFPGNGPEEEYKTFLNVSARFVSAKHIPLPRFALITKAAVSRDVGMQKGTVAIFKDFEDKGKITYNGKMTDNEAMLKFCEEEAQPVVFPYGPTAYSFKTSHTTVKYQHLLFMDPSDSKFKQTIANFRAAGKNFMKSLDEIEVIFIHVDVTNKDIERVISFFHVDVKKDIPCNRITQKDAFHSRFVPEKMDFTKEGFIDFTRKILAGKQKRSIRSEVLPGDWNKYPLKRLVGTNYEEVTQAKGKAVFVMYYVPDDKKCEEALPIMDEVAMKYRLNDTVVVATMDVSKNDGEVDVHYDFPNFKYFSAENKVARYRGMIGAIAIQNFIDSGGHKDFAGARSPFETEDLYEFESYSDANNDPDILDYEEEEEREHQFTMEELKMIENAVETIEGHQAHDDPNHMVNPDHHEMEEKGIVTDEKDMDPKEHAWHGHHDGDVDHEYHDAHTVVHEKHELPKNFTIKHDEQ